MGKIAHTPINSLPQHVINEIAAFFDESVIRRPVLATISRQWQIAVEQQTFRHICLKSSELARFQHIVLKHSHRRRYINQIDFEIVLPAYSDSARYRFERESDRKANNQAFTVALHELLHILKDWDTNQDGFIKLSIVDAYSVSDDEALDQAPSHDDESPSDLTGPNPHTIALGPWRHAYSRLELLNSDLPIVPVVKDFTTGGSRTISLCTIISILIHFPNLLAVRLRMHDKERRYPAFRRKIRSELAHALPQLLPTLSAMRSFNIMMYNLLFWSQRWGQASLMLGDATSDPLCSAIRTTTAQCYNMNELSVRGVIDGSLFWPSPHVALPEPYWQNLERLAVQFSMRRPPGGYYFRIVHQRDENAAENLGFTQPSSLETEMPPGHGHGEEEDDEASKNFSLVYHLPSDDVQDSIVVPDDGALEPLIESFGKACLQITTLRSAHLATALPLPSRITARGTKMYPTCFWGVCYISPGAPPWRNPVSLNHAYHENINERRLIWVTKEWRPSIELNMLLRDIGRERYGNNIVEKFLDNAEVSWGNPSLVHNTNRTPPQGP